MTTFRYGSYTHPAGEVNLTRMNVRHRLSPRGRRLSTIYTMYLQGEICAGSQSTISQRIDELIAAYSVDYQDAALLDNSGNPTRHGLTNDDPFCISGVRVLERSWPKGGPAEYATARTFSVTLEAEYADVESPLVAWQETLRFIGDCGPRFDVIETWGGPYPYISTLSTAQRIVQSGVAVGFNAHVDPPGSLFPDIEHRDRRDIELDGGKNQGRLNCYFQTRWTYYHTSGVARAGLPNMR